MEVQLWRNATVLLSILDKKILIDPMLGKKGSFGKFPFTKDENLNPLVNLPFSDEDLKSQLSQIDGVVITHLHPDHWDEAAIELLGKNLTIFCPIEIKQKIEDYGFINVLGIDDILVYEEILIIKTIGKHGTGEIGSMMGNAYGFVFSTNKYSIYFAGDTILCDEVKSNILTYNPDVIVVAGGAATFDIGDPVTMTAKQIAEISETYPHLKVIVTHLECVSPCKESRAQTLSVLNELTSRNFIVPDDGTSIFI